MATTTRDKLVQIVRANPGKYRESELSRQLGVSRETVRRLINKLGLRDLVKQRQWAAFCVDCGKRISKVGGLCRDCWLKKYGAKKVTLLCDNCGRTFERKESEVKKPEARGSKHHFCNRACYARYWAVHYAPTLNVDSKRIKEIADLLLTGEHS